MTPNEARKENNRLQVKLNLEMTRISKRKYPEISIGSKVKIYKKKHTFDKEFKSVWLPDVHTVLNITKSFHQTYYYVDNFKQPLLRNEILLVH